MLFLEQIDTYRNSDRLAFQNGEQSLSYSRLHRYSDRLAALIRQRLGDDRSPLLVYGHKSPLMLVSFLACVKAGHAYCPIDLSFPHSRVQDIVDAVEPKLILATADWPLEHSEAVLTEADMDQLIRQEPAEGDEPFDWRAVSVREDETYYIIFTSGSTGKPKGVQITYANLNHYIAWINTVGTSKTQKVYLNQAPFSFDLSVMDLHLSLANEGTLYAIDKEIQLDYAKLFAALRAGRLNVWVSTPSFADICLADPSFSEEEMPGLELFLFCGETLTNKTAARLKKRFPQAQVFNTYGPTESTVCITEVEITDEVLAKYEPLPIGAAKPGTLVRIQNGDEILPAGEAGEIVILGDTVSSGYFKNPQQSEKAFFTDTVTGMRGYRTGDKGYLKDGQLFYQGRIDLQIKLHGYRIEIEDIESNLMKLPGMDKVVVLPNIDKQQKVKSITAYCMYQPPAEAKEEPEAEQVARIKQELAAFVPAYMIPKKIVLMDAIPVTTNGKADRRALLKELGK
ncbi:MAG: D-alanine--poly(phosphoribitol) ligase subunit DltA [Eubacteriales bacterium]|nr:D-alanine--poly(phosphoribitol) ligase subunit DltA [Eubacteriales bacterium]